MAMDKGTRTGLLITAGVILAAALFFAFRKPRNGQSKPNGQQGTGGLPAHCNPNRPGYNVYGLPDYTCGEFDECDPARPGFRKSGIRDTECGSVNCDPNRPGWNIYGLPDNECGFFGRMAQRNSYTLPKTVTDPKTGTQRAISCMGTYVGNSIKLCCYAYENNQYIDFGCWTGATRQQAEDKAIAGAQGILNQRTA